MTDPTPNPVFARKLADLVELGYRRSGVLLSLPGTEPEQLVGITEFGKVAWWPTSAPKPDDMVAALMEWVAREDKSLIGAIQHMGMAVGTILKMQQEIRNLSADVAHHKLVADRLLERDYRGKQEE